MQTTLELMVLDKILVRVKFVSRILNLCFKVGKEPRLCVNLVHSGGPNNTASVLDSFDYKVLTSIHINGAKDRSMS